MKKSKPLGYICGTDPEDINLGATDVKIYPTLKALKKARKCYKECGVLSIKIDKVIVKQNLKGWV